MYDCGYTVKNNELLTFLKEIITFLSLLDIYSVMFYFNILNQYFLILINTILNYNVMIFLTKKIFKHIPFTLDLLNIFYNNGKIDIWYAKSLVKNCE